MVWTFFFESSKTKARKRLAFDCLSRYLVTALNIRQLQHVLGKIRGWYIPWCKRRNLGPLVKEIEGVNPLWFGKRALEKVIVYLRGGGFLVPGGPGHFEYPSHTQTALKEKGINVSVVMVEYTLVPKVIFPTPLKQTFAAVNHLMNLGVDPQNIQFMGDSAGGNLILQVFGHLLHPLESENEPAPSLPTHFKGIYLISPWVDLSDIFEPLVAVTAPITSTLKLLNIEVR